MNRDGDEFARRNYLLTMRLAAATQRLLLLALSLLALAVIASFALGVYAAVVLGAFFTAVIWLALSVLSFLAVRRLVKSSQDLLSAIQDLMEAAEQEPRLKEDESMRQLHKDLKKLFPFAGRRTQLQNADNDRR